MIILDSPEINNTCIICLDENKVCLHSLLLTLQRRYFVSSLHKEKAVARLLFLFVGDDMIHPMKKNFFLILLFILVLPFFARAQAANIGIVKGLWFSQNPLVEGETIRVYAALQNNSGQDATIDVEFYQDERSLGSRTVNILNQRILETWIDTKLAAGEHTFSAVVQQVNLDRPGDNIIEAEARTIESIEIVVVDTDTDGDGIGNKYDTDDDNDGFSDEEEDKAGTDSLDKNNFPKSQDSIKESQNTFETILDVFRGDENNQDISDEESGVSKTDSEFPDVVKHVTQQSSIVRVLASGVSGVQDAGIRIIEQEQQRIEKNETTARDEEVETPLLTVIYKKLLQFFAWLLGCWWCVLAIVFLAIYLVLRCLFKRFGRRRR